MQFGFHAHNAIRFSPQVWGTPQLVRQAHARLIRLRIPQLIVLLYVGLQRATLPLHVLDCICRPNGQTTVATSQDTCKSEWSRFGCISRQSVSSLVLYFHFCSLCCALYVAELTFVLLVGLSCLILQLINQSIHQSINLKASLKVSNMHVAPGGLSCSL